MSVELRQARFEDLDHILALYAEVAGSPGCTWDDTYPNRDSLNDDFASDNLYVLMLEDRLIGAGSIVSKNELDELDCWMTGHGYVCEIARLVVGLRYQGRGYGVRMVGKLIEILKSRGCSVIHLLAADTHVAAIRMYERHGFLKRGRVDLYGHRYFAMELRIAELT